jgi:hypothetical protein
MRAFEVSINGEKLCVAGIGDDGVLTTIVHFSVQHRDGGSFLQVGGLIGQTQDHVNWVNQKPLKLGDNVEVRIVETEAADSPIDAYRLDPTS